MAIFLLHSRPVPRADRRLAGLAVTVLLHAALLLAWQGARTPSPPDTDGNRATIYWIRPPASPPLLPAVSPAHRAPAATHPPASPPARPVGVRREAAPAAAPTMSAIPAPGAVPDATAPLPAQPAPAETIMEKARRSAGAIDRDLRKANRPYIVAPLDSPEIRMRAGMARAHDMAAPRLWEAPVVEELVNQTGDGARRSRVRTGLGTYCITERSPITSVETIERHGKLRLTNCPQHEDTATQQAWRTARD
jgi:hypothetical protein